MGTKANLHREARRAVLRVFQTVVALEQAKSELGSPAKEFLALPDGRDESATRVNVGLGPMGTVSWRNTPRHRQGIAGARQPNGRSRFGQCRTLGDRPSSAIVDGAGEECRKVLSVVARPIRSIDVP